jgi:hypothetical protein
MTSWKVIAEKFGCSLAISYAIAISVWGKTELVSIGVALLPSWIFVYIVPVLVSLIYTGSTVKWPKFGKSHSKMLALLNDLELEVAAENGPMENVEILRKFALSLLKNDSQS